MGFMLWKIVFRILLILELLATVALMAYTTG